MPASILLYRYLNASAAVRTLEKKSFRVGRVAEFNDPFEWRLGFKNYIPEGEQPLRAAQAHVLDRMNSQFGVICFSDTLEDSVLWSQYADHHRGMVLEVDHWRNEHLHPVTYSDERPCIDLQQLHRPDAEAHLSEVLKRMLAHKSRGWSYEREYRVFVDLVTCTVADGSYFLPIPTDFLKRVILGFRCSIDEAYVRRCLDLAGLHNVSVVRAADDHHSYKIRC